MVVREAGGLAAAVRFRPPRQKQGRNKAINYKNMIEKKNFSPMPFNLSFEMFSIVITAESTFG